MQCMHKTFGATIQRRLTTCGVAFAGAQHLVWLLLSAILWLGNVGFEPASDDTVAVRRDEALANAAALLGVGEAELAKALSERTLSAGGGSGMPVEVPGVS